MFSSPRFGGFKIAFCLFLLPFFLIPQQALAFEYEFEVPIQDEEDINDAYALGLIENEETVNALINMIRDGLDINKARYNDLLQLPGITIGMANAIIEKRKELGRFSSLTDLQKVEEVPSEIWEEILPFLKLSALYTESKSDEKVPVTANIRFGYLQYDGFGRDNPVNEVKHNPNFYLKAESTVQIKKYKLSFGTLMTVRDLFKDILYGRNNFAIYQYSVGDHNLYKLGFNYDKNNDYLTAPNAGALAYSFDGMYGMIEGPLFKNVTGSSFKTIIGSYNIGFGEKLTFDSTGGTKPNGITTPLHYYENNYSGTVKPERSLLGLATTFDFLRLPKGWMTASIFLSYKVEDLYQYDFAYGADENGDFIKCTSNADCNNGDPLKKYTCGADGYCHTSRIYAEEPNSEGKLESYLYTNMYRFYQERLFGGQVAYNLNDRTRFGLIGYAAQWLFAEDINGASFALGAAFPQRGHIYAFGAYGAVGIGVVDMGFEATIQDNKGVGAVYRLEASPHKTLDLSWRMRFFNALYDNPYGRASAAADELLGKRNRNEFGNRLVLTYRPIKYLRIATDFDIWSHPFTEVELDNGNIYQFANEAWITDLALTQRFVIHPNLRNSITLWAAYKNRDLSVNGFSYTDDKGAEKGNAYASRANIGGIYVEGRGEQIQAALQGQINAYKPLNISLAFINCFEGVTKYTDKFDYSFKLWLMLNYKPWKYTTISTKFKYWYHDSDVDYSEGSYYADRAEPTIDWYIFFTQQFPMGFAIKAHYGITKYIDNRKNSSDQFLRYDKYQIFKAYIEWNYESMLVNKSFSTMRENGRKK